MDLASIERACKTVVGGSTVDPVAFQEANTQIMELGSNTDNIPILQEIFTNSNESPAILVAANCLTSLMTEYWTSFTEAQRAEMRDYLLSFLANKGTEFDVYAIKAVVVLICRITKYGWMDEGDEMRQIVEHTTRFLQHTVSHCIIGLTILNNLVTEMNYKSTNRTITQHRKVATSFRDLALFQVFEVSLSMLNQVATRSIDLAGLAEADARRVEDRIAEESLQLIYNCLAFDFIGTNPEDDSEINAIQVPASWRDRLQTGAPLRLLFNLYKGFTTGRIPTIPDAQPPSGKPSGLGAGSSGATAPRPGAFGGAYGGPPFSGMASGGATTREMPKSEERAAQALEALSMMVSVRRSLFSVESERKRYLLSIIRGTCDILNEEAGFTDENCFHGFTRLLSKIKVSFQLSELVAVEGYAEWVSLTAAFTIKCCQTPSWSANSMSYLLNLWSRLVASVPYLINEHNARGTPSAAPDFAFDAYIPKIVAEYVRGRLNALSKPDEADEILEQLDDLARIEDELEHLPAISRYSYEATARLLLEIIEPLLNRYHEGLQFVRNNAGSAPVDDALAALKQLECQLAWVVSVIGAIVGGGGANSMGAVSLYTSYAAGVLGGGMGGPSGQAGEEVWDAELIKRVLTLMSALDDTLTEAAGGMMPSVAITNPYVRMCRVDQRLELAFISFLGNFRKAYINEQGGLPTQTVGTASIAAASGAGAQNLLLSSEKPMTTAQALEAAKAALAEPQSLQDMYESATGRTKTFLSMLIRLGVGDHTVVVSMMITKLANNLRYWAEREDIISRSLDVLNELIYSYSSGRLLLTLDVINTLLVNHTEDYFPFLSVSGHERFRTLFYSALARLVFMEDENEKFEPFIEPICSNLEKLGPVVQSKDPTVRQMIIGLCRDLRGILQAAHNRPTYVQVFDAIFPRHVQTLVQAMDTWWDDPGVTTSLLKFMTELVYNRGQRISFGAASANGILLFREASNLIVSYGSRIADVTPSGDLYLNKFKGITIVLMMLLKVLDGGYVNFGVFPLYGDPALENALATALKLTLPLGLETINSHPKFALAFVSFLHDAFRSHMDYLVTLDTSSFLSLIHALTSALDALNMEVSSQGAYGLDHFASYFVRNSRKDGATINALRGHVSTQPTIFEVLMKIVFDIVVFGDIGNQWSMARPLLPLILAAEQGRPGSFVEFKNDVVANQPSDVQARMEEEFDKLMKDITKTLDAVNRDRFQNRITVFKITVKEFAKIP